MITEKEKLDVTDTGSTAPRRRGSGNLMLTVNIMIIASVLLAVLWILDALVTK